MDDLDARDDDPDALSATCPKCGSDQLTWSLRRSTAKGHPRYFAWACRECGAAWAEPIVLGMKPIIEDVGEDHTA